MNKVEILKELMAEWGSYTSNSGRPVEAFTIEWNGPTWHQLSRSAYTKRYNNFKLVVAIDQGRPLKEPMKQAKGGSAYYPLSIYMLDCLPDYSGKDDDTAKIKAIKNLNSLRMKTNDLVLEKLNSGHLLDADYSARLLDDERFYKFAQSWFERETGNRAI